MYRSIFTACALVPFVIGCVTSEEDIGSDEAFEDVSDDVTLQSTSQSLFGSDSCRNTDIFITNSRTRNGVDTAIEVHSVEFYSSSEGRWYSEDLTNEIVNFATTHTWWNEDLAHAENDLITKWRVYYKYASGGSWSSVVYQEIDTPNETCLADANFEMTVE
jgi:hypothetical protein